MSRVAFASAFASASAFAFAFAFASAFASAFALTPPATADDDDAAGLRTGTSDPAIVTPSSASTRLRTSPKNRTGSTHAWSATFTGSLTDKDKVLALARTDGPAAEEQRLVFSLLHHNRHLYRFETRPAGTTVAYGKKYQVGATKEGEAFANVPKGPECIVSGGLGTMKVTYKGKDYYVCCSGCRDEFKSDPEKYIKEAEAKAKEKK